MASRAEYHKNWRERNKEHVLSYQRQWNADNRDKCRTKNNKRTITRYGITPEQWKEMKNRGCGICGTTADLVIDHCHITNKVRGALCRLHNAALGKFKDSPHLLRAAIRWVGGEAGWEA